MFYEEKIIEGVLCWRTSPDDTFTACSIFELSERLVGLQKHCEDLQEKVRRLEDVAFLLGVRIG